jgi:ATP-dependent Clp protease ATP-binding subunit ClpA
MFERFTHGARQVIFHARDQALRDGAGRIETLHLLRGLELEDKETTDHFIAVHPELERLRQIQPSLGPPADPKDMKLSKESIEVLAWAAESSDKGGSRSIGSADLLAGLLREIENREANRPVRLSLRGKLGRIVDRLRGVR